MTQGSRLTIVHVLSSFGVGGAEQVALDLASRQREAGHNVHAVSLTAGAVEANATRFEKAKVGVAHIGKHGPTLDPTLPMRLAAHFLRVGAEVVHSHNPMPLIYATPAAKLARVPHVYTKHGANNTAGAELLRKLAGPRVNAFVAVSGQTARDAVRQRERKSDQILILDNGIDVAQYERNHEHRKAIRDELGVEDSVALVGTVGRLSPIKNQTLLVRACAPLLGPERRLVLIGDGPSRQQVERAVADSGASAYIRLLGQRMDVKRILSALDLFVLTSDNEGLPLAIPEAMAAGLPVVSTSVGGIPDVVIDGETGRLVPPGDELRLRQVLSEVLEDRGQMSMWGKRGQELARSRYSVERMYDGYMQLYETVRRR